MLHGIDLLLQAPCLAGIDISELEGIPLRRADYAAGEWIFTPNTVSRDLLFVAQGMLELLEARRRDHLTPLVRLGPGDTLGEHRLEARPQPWAARAASDAVVYRWPADDLASFLENHPDAAQALRFQAESRRLTARLNLGWLAGDETVHGLARRHPALLVRALLLPSVLLTSALGLLAVGGLGESWLTLAAGGLLGVVGAAWGAWNALDWRNDYYVVTDRRVVWLEKVIGLYDSRQESPLRMILSVEVESGLLGRQLGFGDVEVRTYTGSLLLADVPWPEAMATLIETLARRLQQSTRQSDRQAIHEALQQRLAGTAQQPVSETRRSRRREEAHGQASVGLDRWSFEARFEQDGVITYRKHPAVLLQRLFLPSILLLTVLGLGAATAAGLLSGGGSGLFWPLLGASALAAVLWWAYEFADWANDLYQISPSHILAIHKKPLGRESRKVAPLENVLGTEVDRRGLVGVLLNYGDVVVSVGADRFLFEDVLDPSSAQQDLARAQEALVDRKIQSDRQRRQDEMVEWLTAYHQQTSPPGSPSSTDASET
jgi:CRP-like cAMP-binding protein